MGSSRAGAGGADAIIRVPVGTQILDEDRATILADMTEAGQQIVLAQGGSGGKGNEAFKSATNRAPRHYDPGGEAQEFTLWLRLKLIADAGLVGLPNAGKSTFLTSVSRARPKIGDYPFTTLYPNLGVAQARGREIVLADIPGLIEGAHEGAGLGDRFLGHVERCQALLHLVDGTAVNVVSDYQTVRNELQAYDEDLADKQELVCLNKCDALTDDLINERREALTNAAHSSVHVISGMAGLGVAELLANLAQNMDDEDASDKPEYQASLEAECGEPLSEYFGSGTTTLAGYMREQGIQNTILMGAVSSHCVSETAVSAAVKGFNPQIITDSVLSWQGDEDKVDPRTSLLHWRGTAGDEVAFDTYHQEKITTKIADIVSDHTRGFTSDHMKAISSIGFASSAMLPHKFVSNGFGSGLAHQPEVA